MDDQPLAARIAASMKGSDFDWRTPDGLARELQAAPEDVLRVLSGSGLFIRSKIPNAKGESLFTTVDRYKSNTPFLKRLLGAGGNTITQ